MSPLHLLSVSNADAICTTLMGWKRSGDGESAVAWSAVDPTWLGLPEPQDALIRARGAAVAVVNYEPQNPRNDALEKHIWLLGQLGVPFLVVALDSDHLPPDGRKGFDRLIQRLDSYIKSNCTFRDVLFVPVESKSGGNILDRASNIGWYMGPTIAAFLEDEVVPDVAKRETGTRNSIASDHFQARLIWLDEKPLLAWRPLAIDMSGTLVDGSVTAIKYEVDAGVDERVARNRLLKGDVGVCNIKTDAQCELTEFSEDRNAGTFLVKSPDDGRVVAFGLVDHSLRRATNVKWQETSVTPDRRAQHKQQTPTILWFTGLSGAGKSTIADLVEQKLSAAGRHTMLLDGDNVRHGLNKDLGFTETDRVENIRRIAEVSKLMCDAGLIVMVSFISPFRSERQLARETAGAHGFCEIYVSTPLDVAEDRDVKGLYAKARRGEIKNFTGIDSPYEAPENPEIVVDTSKETAEAAAGRIVAQLFGL